MTTSKLAALAALLLATSCIADDAEPQTNDVPRTESAPTDATPMADEGDDEREPVVEDVVEQEPEVEPELPADICASAPDCVDSFPALIVDTTVDGDRQLDGYGCAAELNESGPERVYRVVVATAGFLALRVNDRETDADIDIHLLSSADASSCIDRGHHTAGAYVEPGTYFVVADTWVDEFGTEYGGDFELEINLIGADDFTVVGVDADLAQDALKAFSTAWVQDDTDRLQYTLTDFSLHSSVERQWVFDLATGELLYKLTVGHGEASIVGEDLGYASVFSNIPESHQSSLGLIRTAETYFGDYGYSLAVDGLEVGFNDNVRRRAIVVHPWYGNEPAVVGENGWVVPTWGCATLDPAISEEVIDTISEGSLMFFWYPDPTWRNASTYL